MTLWLWLVALVALVALTDTAAFWLVTSREHRRSLRVAFEMMQFELARAQIAVDCAYDLIEKLADDPEMALVCVREVLEPMRSLVDIEQDWPAC